MTGPSRRAWIGGAAALLAGAAHATPRWPARAIRILVVYPPGGVSDTVARACAAPLSRLLGVPVLVEHRPGAGGSIGMAALARSVPDGHTLAFSATTPLTLKPLLPGAPAHDPLDEVAPVIGVMHTPVFVLGTPALAGLSFAGMVERALALPGRLRWATSGVATTGHLVLVQTRLGSGADIAHVPYQGGGPQLNDALSGQFEVLSSNVAPLQLRYVRAGRLVALAVGGPARVAALPEVPTLAELGYPQANLSSVFGVFAPAGTPDAVLDRLHAAFDAVLRSDEIERLLRVAQNLPAAGPRDAFARWVHAERDDHRALAARLGDSLAR